MGGIHRLLLVVAGALSFVPRSNIRAQIHGTGRITGAIPLVPVDASAVGATRGSSIGLFVTQGAYGAGVGMGVAGGALRGSLDGSANRYSGGVGFARTLVKRSLAGAVYALVGGQLSAGYLHTVYHPHDAGAVDLTIPVGIALGEPDSYSFTAYVTPYAEVGMMRITHWSCPPFGGCRFSTGNTELVHGLSAAAGTRVSINRFSIDLAVPNAGALTLGLVYRVGPPRLR